MTPTQRIPRNQPTNAQSHPRRHRIQNPHRAQRIRKRPASHLFLGRRQRVDEAHVGTRGAGGESGGGFRAEGGDEEGALGGDLVLEDYAADDDGDGGAEVADEAEGGGCGGDVAFLGGWVS